MPGDPKRPADLLPGILRGARTLAARSETARALAAVLGAETAAHCRVAGECGGRLVVEVDSAPLFAELQGFRREEIRQALNDHFGRARVGRLAFRLQRAHDA